MMIKYQHERAACCYHVGLNAISNSALTNWGEEWETSVPFLPYSSRLGFSFVTYSSFSFTVLGYLIFLVLRNNAFRRFSSNFIL